MRDSPACCSGPMVLDPKSLKTCARNRRISVILTEILMAKGFFAAAREIFAVRFKDLATPARGFTIGVAVLFHTCTTCVAVPLSGKRYFPISVLSMYCWNRSRKTSGSCGQLVQTFVDFHK